MRANGWRGVRGRRRSAPPSPDPATPRHPDLVKRELPGDAPGSCWSRTSPMSAGRRRVRLRRVRHRCLRGTIVGWECSTSKTIGSCSRRSPRRATPVHGRQSVVRPGDSSFGRGHAVHLGAVRGDSVAVGVVPSVGTVGDAFDNALAETTIGLYKSDAVRTGRRSARPDRRLATWRCSPQPGCTGTTPTGSCTASGCGPRPNTRPSTTLQTQPTQRLHTHNHVCIEPGAVHPGWLAWVTEFVNMGQAWPGPPASETGCWHDADDLRVMADAARVSISELKQLRSRATQPDAVLAAALVGDTAGVVDAQFSALVAGLEKSVDALIKSAKMGLLHDQVTVSVTRPDEPVWS